MDETWLFCEQYGCTAVRAPEAESTLWTTQFYGLEALHSKEPADSRCATFGYAENLLAFSQDYFRNEAKPYHSRDEQQSTRCLRSRCRTWAAFSLAPFCSVSMPLYEERLINPLSVRFSQDRMWEEFSDGRPVEETVWEIAANGGEDGYDLLLSPPFPSVEIVRLRQQRREGSTGIVNERGERLYGEESWQ
ncbi:hypothetical protein AK812_SmicGene42375, partial [Symbiodinium microadriaticum]